MPSKEPTLRELQVLQLLSVGMKRSEIAERLGCSTETVRQHVQNCIARLHVHSALHAVAIAMRRGWIE